ncbi:uncharacterized protein HMPREF1541_04900 [Cyphellophora europaea CBS 101466]|uniref:Filamentation protein n=1 Tax=Cyphellophora europaea (strain CBS 101466) TaxID=1220924 RepID=W2RXW6_CYPE1|nr:uncharacterized protein HMPREF1541_04900 [Cyphellophora europaea CBS 101466]ETN40623.1 hypothetical protein HMPREF1541_04900 [Cyphellophora europaea CBS 101466]
MSGRDDKAQRYIALLDDARVDAKWSELPELIRKVTKHAPQRKCLIHTATLEHEVVNTKIAATSRPTTASTARTPLASRITDVEKEIEAGSEINSETIQARAALLWAYWVAPEHQGLSDSLLWSETPNTSDRSLWTNICIAKSAYMRGAILRSKEKPAEAAQAFQSAIPWIEANKANITATAQLSYWVEQLLAEVAIDRSRVLSKGSIDASTNSYFRSWSLLSLKGRPHSPRTYGNPGSQRSRLSVWNAYYSYLSDIIQASSNELPRHELVTELRRVEAAYENELLNNTQFPKAGASNAVIEQWVEQATTNWEVICGSDWSEQDIGEGGRNLITRNVLDILYRAAMKTFHSTLILRKLFQTHKALAEFDLAYRALDSYLELIDRGRERAARTQEPQDQDNDETVLLTISEGVLGLCSFGQQAEAEKAHVLCTKLQSLFTESDPTASTLPGQQLELNGFHHRVHEVIELPPTTIETVHRALGIGKAHWARWTPFNEHRTNLQSSAVAHLKAAIAQPLSTSQKQQSFFALGLLLAETRDIDTAVDYVKEALADRIDSTSDFYLQERRFLPLWHLLSLLLTSRQDYETSSKACIAAFEQFPGPEILFGSSRHIDEEKHASPNGLVDDMECAELQRILEVRMTELALTDLTEGPEDAVNSSNDLLALYSRLFGRLGVTAEEKAAEKPSEVPKTSAGTIKSFRGSLFRRSRIILSEAQSVRTNGVAASINTDTTRPTTRATEAPTIHVTDEDEKSSPHKHRLFRHSHEHNRKGRLSSDSHSTSLSSRLRPHSKERRPLPVPSTIASSRQSFETGVSAQPSSTGSVETARPHLETIQSVDTVPAPQPPTSATHNAEASAKQPIGEIPHNVTSHSEAPPPLQHSEQPPEQDTRMPTISPTSASTSLVPRFPLAAAKKHALAILVSIWLVIARLYRHANMYDDSREATDEAAKAALKIEALVATTVESSARAFADSSSGSGGKSSDECWADVYCERGELLLAVAEAKFDSSVTDPAQTSATATAERDETVRDAVEMLEQALMYKQTHLRTGIVLSNVLLDYYERKVELGRGGNDDEGVLRKFGAVIPKDMPKKERERERKHERTETSLSITTINGINTVDGVPVSTPEKLADDDLKKTPENLNRLAARDRAYGLLSSLTKTGEGWDDSEAWFALARAHELGGEVERAKEILWWVVSLEDTRPLRKWSCVSFGYVL